MLKSPETRIVPLVELIYRAAVVPDLWTEFLEALSDELDAPIIAMNLEVPGAPSVRRVYRVNSPARFGRVFAEFAMRGEIPWDLSQVSGTRFHPASELIPDGKSKPLEIEGYACSPDLSLLLIYTNSERVWRSKSRGDYWLLDRSSHELRKLGGDAPPSLRCSEIRLKMMRIRVWSIALARATSVRAWARSVRRRSRERTPQPCDL